MAKITVILPAFNEERAIGKVIDEIGALPLDCQVIVADGGSQDLTIVEAKKRGAYVVIEMRKGKGIAFRTALNYVETPFTVMMDADYTYPALAIAPIVSSLATGADAVMGIRKYRVKGSMTLTNRFGNRCLSLMASMLYGVRTQDVCTGMWGFKTDVLKGFDIRSVGFTLEAELFVNAVRNGCKIKQIPIAYRERLGGSKPKLKMRDGLKIGWFLIRRRFQ